METKQNNTRLFGSKARKVTVLILSLTIFLSVTYLMFPKHYFTDHDTFSYNGSYITWLPIETNTISNQEILQKSGYLEFNWLILSPWHTWYVMDQKIDCHGTFWFCPANQQFKNLLLLLVVYLSLFSMMVFWKSKLKYVVLGLVVIASGLVGLKMTHRYLYAPLKFHNSLLQQFSDISNTAPFPSGLKITGPARYEDKDNEIKIGATYNGESNGYLDFLIFPTSQDENRLKQIMNGQTYCNDRIPNVTTRNISNNLYFCEFSGSSGSTYAAMYGFLDANRKIFVIYYNNITERESLADFKSNISSFLNFYNAPPDFAYTPITTTWQTGWPTYKNSDYGFEVSYPTDWEVKENPTNVVLQSKIIEDGPGQNRGNAFVFYSRSLVDYLKSVDVYNHNVKTLQEYLDTYKDVKYCTTGGGLIEGTEYCEDYQNITFKDRKAFLVYTAGHEPGLNVVLENNGQVFVIELPGGSQFLNESGLNRPILSNFKFTQ